MSTTPYPGPDEVIIPSRIYFDINVDDAIYEVLTMPKEKITI